MNEPERIDAGVYEVYQYYGYTIQRSDQPGYTDRWFVYRERRPFRALLRGLDEKLIPFGSLEEAVAWLTQNPDALPSWGIIYHEGPPAPGGSTAASGCWKPSPCVAGVHWWRCTGVFIACGYSRCRRRPIWATGGHPEMALFVRRVWWPTIALMTPQIRRPIDHSSDATKVPKMLQRTP